MISAQDLAKKKFTGIRMPGNYGTLIGTVPPSVSMVIWGPKGSLKSTMAIDMAYQLAKVLGKGIYCSSEEGSGPALQNKIKRLGAQHPNLLISDYDNLEKLKTEIEVTHAKFVILDSISMGYIKPDEFRRFMEFCKREKCMLIYILHATKDGNYKGPSEYVHWPDVEIKAVDGVAQTEKNRFKETPQTMNIVSSRTSRENQEIPAVSNNEFGSYTNISDLKKKALAWAKKNLVGKDVLNDEQKIHIHLNWQGLKKAAGSYYTINKLLSIRKLPVLLKKAHLVSIDPDRKKRSEIKAIYKFETPVSIKGAQYTAHLVVRETKQGRFYYDHNLIEIRKPDGISGDFSQKRKNTHQPSPGSPNKIGTSSKNNNIQDNDQTNNRRGKKDMGRPSGKSKGGNSPTRKNPVFSFSDPLIYLGKVMKLEIDTPEGTRILKRGKDDKPLEMFESLKKKRLYIIGQEYIKPVKDKVHSSKADHKFYEWNGYNDNMDFAIEWPEKGAKAISIGTADVIYYQSDKIMKPGDHKGKEHYYYHNFDKGKRPVSVLGHVLIISDIKVNERGILN